MPGKYSHSVVLADYSSRGIINLPNDQHVAYLKSSPYPGAPYSRASSRAGSERLHAQHPRSRSALDHTSNHGYDTGSFAASGRKVIIDAGRESGISGRASTTLQRPSSSDGGRTASTKGVQTMTQTRQPPHSRNVPPAAVGAITGVSKPTSNETQHPALRSQSSQGSRVRAEEFLRDTPRAASQARNYQQALVAQSNTAAVGTQKTPAKLGPAIEITSREDGNDVVAKPAPSIRLTSVNSVHSTATPFQRSSSQDTQIYASRVSVEEPDFEGFSDVGEPETSYFEKHVRSNSASAPRSMFQIAHRSDRFETPPSGRTSRASDSRVKAYRPLSTEPSVSNVVAGVAASPTLSHGRLDSLTSLSTNSSRGITPASRTAKHSDVKKTTVDHSAQDWRLPEIHEDIAFDPDFFTQEPEDFVQPKTSNESVDSFLNRPLGTISAGRDVDFSKDNDGDADSEADDACPPDIGRFRNDNEFGSASFLQATKNDDLGKGTGSSASTPRAKKSGFFAKLRSASRQRS